MVGSKLTLRCFALARRYIFSPTNQLNVRISANEGSYCTSARYFLTSAQIKINIRLFIIFSSISLRIFKFTAIASPCIPSVTELGLKTILDRESSKEITVCNDQRERDNFIFTSK